jgi:hypothetical protein
MPLFPSVDAQTVFNNAQEPSGWRPTGGMGTTETYASSSSAISVNDGTRTFSITPIGSSFTFYVYGVPFTKTAADSVTFTNTEGTWFFYYDVNGVLQSTQSATSWFNTLLGNGALVASIYWDAQNAQTILFSEERHGFMQGDIHLEMHSTFGTEWVSGGVITNSATGSGAAAADAQLDVSTVTIYDEDIRMTWANHLPQKLATPARIPIYYRYGNLGVWRRKAADDYPLIYPGTAPFATGSRVPYNQNTGTNWQLTDIANSDYVLIHYYATNDIREPIIGIQGQSTYTTLSLAQAGIQTELLRISAINKTLSAEIAPLGSVIVQSSNTYGNTPKARFVPVDAVNNTYVDFRGNTYRGGTSAGITTHGQLSGLSADDHTQYILVDGTRAFTGPQSMGNNNLTNIKVAYYNTWQTLTASTATTSVDFTAYQQATVLLATSSTTITLAQPPGPGAFRLTLIQDTTGSRSVSWAVSGTGVQLWGVSGSLQIATSASARTAVGLWYDGTFWTGVASSPMQRIV